MAEVMIPTVYEPHEVEAKHYQKWIDAGYFHASPNPDKKPYCIVIPPPNVTGALHMGHALDNTMQDVLIRFKRKQGFEALWMPGTDHAGIATQAKVEESLAQEGLSRYDLGREKFLEKVWDWKRQFGSRIITQLKSLGASCDWERERFTMDEGCSKAVREVFVRLYEKGLIYRGYRIINWCPNCRTALSDIEVDHLDSEGFLWHIKYPVKDEPGRYLTVATTRPETMLGDTAVAVNPKDARYSDLIGKKLVLPLVNREIEIIADEYVDMEFGTGAVKITPAHDPNDFEMGLRHNLEQIIIMKNDATMADDLGKYSGLERYECRNLIVSDLKEQGLLHDIVNHSHAVGHCSRCGTTVEPMLSKQWFVKMKPLAEPAIEIVTSGEVRIVPDRFIKIYLNWLENIQDWCISRQLWWGHRIPVWYCADCGEMTVGKEDPTACAKCGSTSIEQDADVLDTWFSSALWPFSTLGWPDKTPELDYFYPTAVLVTGRDILFFWVARMIFTGLEFMPPKPFNDVLIHGLVLDSQGRKMSKSLGNGIDPLDIIEKYGADTLRFTLITGNAPGSDMRFFDERVEASRNFSNKLWNASRFVMMNLGENVCLEKPDAQAMQLSTADRWILSRYAKLVKIVTEDLENYRLGEAATKLHEFIWSEFCDWYIEMAKSSLYNQEDAAGKLATQNVLAYVLSGTLDLLHPFMPFVTEEIWQALRQTQDSIVVSQWPQFEASLVDEAAEAAMEMVMETVRAVRNVRSDLNVPPGKRIDAIFVTEDAKKIAIITGNDHYLKALARFESIRIVAALDIDPNSAVTARAGGVEIYMPLAGLVDIAKEQERLNNELAAMKKEIARSQGLLSGSFAQKAPAEIVAAEREKFENYKEKMQQVSQRIKLLSDL